MSSLKADARSFSRLREKERASARVGCRDLSGRARNVDDVRRVRQPSITTRLRRATWLPLEGRRKTRGQIAAMACRLLHLNHDANATHIRLGPDCRALSEPRRRPRARQTKNLAHAAVSRRGIECVRLSSPRPTAIGTRPGLDVQISRGYGSVVAAQAVATGKVSIRAGVGVGRSAAESPKGLPLVSIACCGYDATMGLCVAKDSPIKSPKDLNGKKLGSTISSGEYPFLGLFAQRAGLRSEERPDRPDGCQRAPAPARQPRRRRDFRLCDLVHSAARHAEFRRAEHALQPVRPHLLQQRDVDPAGAVCATSASCAPTWPPASSRRSSSRCSTRRAR